METTYENIGRSSVNATVTQNKQVILLLLMSWFYLKIINDYCIVILKNTEQRLQKIIARCFLGSRKT